MFIKQWHPAAEAFPLMQGEKFQEFADDIRAHGVLKPVEFYDGDRWPEFKGLGIDGRNRQAACALWNIDPPLKALTDADVGDSLTSYIASVNVARRHLSSSQAAVVALELEKQFATENAKNRKAGGEKGRQSQTDRAKQNPLVELFPQADFPENTGNENVDSCTTINANAENRAAVKSHDQAADAAGTNAHYITDAKKIAKASPKLLGFIRDDRLTIRDAMFAIKQRKDHEQAFAAFEEGRIDFQRFRDWCYLEKEHPDLWAEFHQNRMECEDALAYAKERDAALRKAESRPVEAESADALKKRVEYAYKKLSDTTSIYRIASTLGISYEVASKIINAMPPEDEELEAASAVQPPPCEQAPDREQAPPKSIATDRLNRPLDAKMVPVFSELAEFDDLIASLGHFKSRIEKLVRQPSGALLNLRVLGDSLKNIEDHLKKKSPLCVCPSCSGAGRQDQPAKTCRICDGKGFICEMTFVRLDKNLQAIANGYKGAVGDERR